MIFNVTGGGGGGTKLNFRVLTYASEIELTTATPDENTVGVITTTPMTSWIFSAEEPSPAEAGMVWIITGASGLVSFNALKKNSLMVYPMSAKQYISGAWVDVTAKSYQGGHWEDWLPAEVYLYNAGDTCDDVTGGWVANNATITHNADNMAIAVAGNYQAGGASTQNTIDLTGYNTIVISVGAYSTDFKLRVMNGTNEVASVQITDGAALDISELSGAYTINIHCPQTASTGRTCTLYSLKLTR